MSTTETEISDKIEDVVHELAPEQNVVLNDSLNLASDLAFSSMNLMELAFAIEEEFEFPPLDINETMSIATIGQLKEFVTAKLA